MRPIDLGIAHARDAGDDRRKYQGRDAIILTSRRNMSLTIEK